MILPIFIVLLLTISCSGNSTDNNSTTNNGTTSSSTTNSSNATSAGDSILGVWQWVGVQNQVLAGTPMPPWSPEDLPPSMQAKVQLKFYRDGTAQLMGASQVGTPNEDTFTLLGTYRLLADGSMIELGTIGDWFVGMVDAGRRNDLGQGIFGLEVDTNQLILNVEVQDGWSSAEWIFEKTEQLN